MPALSPTLLKPYGYSSSTCGYCAPSGSRSVDKSSSSYGMMATQMTPQYYQDLIDRGWRRSGNYLYHPDMARTCCPLYTIRLDTQALRLNKKQRQVVNRFNRYLATGAKPGEEARVAGDVGMRGGAEGGGPHETQGKKGKGRANGGKSDVLSELHRYEIGYGGEEGAQHRFETELVPAKVTDERFQLYKAYQISVHNDEPSEVTQRGFDRFLCSGPLIETPINYASGSKAAARLPENYVYRVDGELVGISVIDILPAGVSSVYFIWRPDWAWAGLGRLSALYEADLARRLAGAGGVEGGGIGWLYMGYWVADCQKMRYKSEYEPSYLLDPGTNEFHRLTPALESYLMSHSKGYHPFAQLDASASLQQQKPPGPASASAPKGLNDLGPSGGDPSTADAGPRDEDPMDDDDDDDEELEDWPRPPPPSFADPASFTEAEVDEVLVLVGSGTAFGRGRRLFKMSELEFVDPPLVRQLARQFMAAVGKDYIGREGDREGGGVAGKGILFFG